MNQNQNNEFGTNPTWNIPSQYSILQAAHQQNQQQNRDEIGADDPNIYTGHGNVYSPEDAVSPPTMATSEAPTNWHEPTPSKSGKPIMRSFGITSDNFVPFRTITIPIF